MEFGNFITQFDYLEERGAVGSANIIQNTTKYDFDDQNSISFNTRRNRKLNLTEYYNLLYEYKNDCLTAGIRYKKRYYNDVDIIPNEELFFSSFNLKTDASLKSIYSSIFSILFLALIFSFLKFKPNVIDSPDSNEFPKLCLLYTSPSPRDGLLSRMPSSA